MIASDDNCVGAECFLGESFARCCWDSLMVPGRRHERYGLVGSGLPLLQLGRSGTITPCLGRALLLHRIIIRKDGGEAERNTPHRPHEEQ